MILGLLGLVDNGDLVRPSGKLVLRQNDAGCNSEGDGVVAGHMAAFHAVLLKIVVHGSLLFWMYRDFPGFRKSR